MVLGVEGQVYEGGGGVGDYGVEVQGYQVVGLGLGVVG